MTTTDRPLELSDRGHEVLDVLAAYRRETADTLRPDALLRAATVKVTAQPDATPHVIHLASAPLRAAEQALFDALDTASRLHVVEAQQRLADATTHLTVAPDAEEEARTVVRRLLAHLGKRPSTPERVAIAYAAAAPTHACSPSS